MLVCIRNCDDSFGLVCSELANRKILQTTCLMVYKVQAGLI